MKNLYIYSIFTLFVLGSVAFAASLDDVQYPVAELGNCANEQACKLYCDQAANIEACLDYGEENGLIPAAEVEEARKVLPYLKSGQTPGGCRSKQACETYCSQDGNFEECISFAERAGLVSAEDAAIARKVGGKGPGGCNSKDSCDAYCQAPGNFNSCIDFAVQHGLISEKEAEMARKVGAGGGPGGCRSEVACRTYCEEPAHGEECINFAVQNGLIPPEEVEMAKKFMAAGGKGPGGCKGKEQCDSYCKDETHMSECIEFAHTIGAISEEDYQRAKQFGSMPRPGGCSSEAECTAYCQDPAHLPECTQFATASGIQMPQGAGGEFGGAAAACQQQGIPLDQCQTFCESNPSACGIPTGGPQGPGGEGSYPSGEQSGTIPQGYGPAACAGMSAEQCTALCTSNPSACGGGAPTGTGGQQPPEGYQQPPTGEQTAPTGEGTQPATSPTPSPSPEPAPAPAPAPTPISGAVTSFINSLVKLLQG